MGAAAHVEDLERDLTPRQIADATQLSYKTILREIDRGRLDAMRVGRELRVPESAYLAWRELCRVRPAESPSTSRSTSSTPRRSRRDEQPGSVARLRAIEET